MRIFAAILSIVLLGGCAYLPQTVGKAKAGSESDAPQQLVLPEAKEVPSIVVPEKNEPPKPIEYRSFAEHYLPTASVDEPSRARGFRVQLLTTKDAAAADSFVVRARNILDMPVYSVYEPPYYKVRAGNFEDHAAAEEAKEKIESKGFDTFIVRDIIETGEAN
ncbi:SPOR domain-containing protein [bacterium]|nr:SPOR domain-containing protein [bacterium]